MNRLILRACVNRRSFIRPLRAAQSGMALLISLMLLLVLSILAVSSMQGTSLQEKMVSAQRDGQIALEGAEHALREAELFLGGAVVPSFTNSNGLFTVTGPAPRGTALWDPATWTDSASQSRAATMPMAEGEALLAEPPRYFIQIMPADAIALNTRMELNMTNYTNNTGVINVTVYRIVARSTGKTGQSPRLVEQYFLR